MTIRMAIVLMRTSQRGHTLTTTSRQYKRQMRRTKKVEKKTPDQKAAIIRMNLMNMSHKSKDSSEP